MRFSVIFLFFLLSIVQQGFADETEPAVSVEDATLDSLEKEVSSGNVKIVELLQQNLAVAVASGDSLRAAKTCYVLGKFFIVTTYNYPVAYNYLLRALSNFEKAGNDLLTGKCEMQIGVIYFLQRNFIESEKYFLSAYEKMMLTGDSIRTARLSYLLSLVYSEKKEFENAFHYLGIAGKYAHDTQKEISVMEYSYGMSYYYLCKGNGDSALFYLEPLMKKVVDTNSVVMERYASNAAHAWRLKNNNQKAEFFAKKAISIGSHINVDHSYISAYYLLYQLSKEKNNLSQAVEYLNKYVQLKDSVLNEKNLFEIASLKIKYELDKERQERNLIEAKKEAEQKAVMARQKSIMYIFIAVSAFVLVFVGFLVYANNLMKKKNIQLAQSIEKLKSTQEQLVHHEKLASMGRLSAGIAHEMRNPLNFVNNFSEITSQMLDEMEMVDTEEERKLIIGTLKSNVSKISQHGKRAEMIVKQIIDHVQTSAGTRELCNINQLCDYYIKMVLHSMSMHKVEFHHKINKQYAPDIPMISVNSQEIGRVLMNIFSNAFQAIEDKLLTGSFLPEITISTGCQNNALFVEVKDNGMGIKKDLLKKIADPFFTTRAPGQGAGLGLSVAHDIIRSYGGSIAVESVENEFTSIRIQIPL